MLAMGRPITQYFRSRVIIYYQMIPSYTYDFCVRESQRLADLYGILNDLLSVQQIIEAYAALPAGRERLVEKNALCIAALTTYARANNSGVRQARTREMVAALTPELRDAHEHFRHMRDKWAAHSVNAHETHYVTLEVVEDSKGALAPQSIGSKETITVYLAPQSMALLMQLAIALWHSVLHEAQEEQKRVLAFARSLDLSELKDNPKLYSCSKSANDDPKCSRIRFEAANSLSKKASKKPGAA